MGSSTLDRASSMSSMHLMVDMLVLGPLHVVKEERGRRKPTELHADHVPIREVILSTVEAALASKGSDLTLDDLDKLSAELEKSETIQVKAAGRLIRVSIGQRRSYLRRSGL